jgi:hypothetical protein
VKQPPRLLGASAEEFFAVAVCAWWHPLHLRYNAQIILAFIGQKKKKNLGLPACTTRERLDALGGHLCTCTAHWNKQSCFNLDFERVCCVVDVDTLVFT